MRITHSMKMADIIHLNHLLLTVIYRFEINLGFGNKSVDEVCEDYDIPTDFFLEIANTFHDKEYFPKQKLQDFSVQIIIKYLQKSHEYYHSEKIPEIEDVIEEMVENCYLQKENMHLLKKFFQEYKQELINHTKHEEDVVFPYSLAIEKFYKSESAQGEFPDELKNYSIDIFEREHDNIEEKLFDLKNIIIKYLPAPQNQMICYKLLDLLFSLEQDINNHSRIEDKVLVPKILHMEKSINK